MSTKFDNAVRTCILLSLKLVPLIPLCHDALLLSVQECTKLQKESLNCLIRNEKHKSACQQFFDRYKKCIKDRHERTIAERRARFNAA
ncbi:hypothetical protein CCR75_004354 [Bremia lactucae]|uniref:CHCH domain-containing protein n=1 Tax=Bremia lactucae TaxID=4779 RepID=A0A976FJY3_BRELC|nr:hypothetical protein CCR75_004354 [Bremia lactucae]